MLGFFADGEGLPGRRICFGDSWKRQGRRSDVFEDELEVDMEFFHVWGM